ncbi:cobyrinate a,c-diamide synthase [Nitrosomonas sp. Is37]|uniref:cobyrinate a,c-diamide synthase n=1 Tax=Nitrosomonas sp. Is37 TaxID=3080535 RepID=UPI00294AB632|nr:cobyrinate a,c-diamide synthase [Nitrosomonas sp. Is37]MDV6344670.1 cobyrinate a,c-diamide synthase [Nitrosomonas sp. Is37]
MKQCPALLIAAPASGQGKTTITAALARFHRNQGREVRAFKIGPDFLDPMILEQASGHPVYQLDLWMCGQSHCQQLLYRAATTADLILIEGVMGLFDGEPSSADLSVTFGIPVLAVIDAAAMAQTFGAVAHGLATFRSSCNVIGVLANQVASSIHEEMLKESLPEYLPWLGSLPCHINGKLPSRHLGLVQAKQINHLDQYLDQLAEYLSLTGLHELPPTITFMPPEDLPTITPELKGIRIAVATDAAFSFIYQANLDLLEALGAQLKFFSPLDDTSLPETDSLYLPGGYPELYMEKLATNQSMHKAIHAHYAAGRPIVAECGGMLYLLSTLTDHHGKTVDFLNLFSGKATMQRNLVNLGLHSARFQQGELRGHTFHHSHLETAIQPSALTQPARKGLQPEALFHLGRLTASFMHWYMPSNPTVTAALFSP